MKVIFTKYSDVGRQKKYRIKTQIIEKNGKKIVFKEALNTESQQHSWIPSKTCKIMDKR